jgi:hypothetical protein
MSSADSAAAFDLTVEQYAGISAALVDGYPLDAVLENEDLALTAWPEADLAWKQRLVAEPATFESYRVRLGEAEDWLGRKVAPLDDDLAAWLGFLGAYAGHAAPFDLLGGLGLGMNDLGRLQRRWDRRLKADDELAKQAAELAKKKPTAVPKVSAAKGILKPFPWSKRRAPLKPPPAEVVLREAPAKAKAAVEAPVYAFAAHPDLLPAAAPMPARIAPPLGAPAPARAPSKLAGTALAADIPRGPALPFSRGIAPKEIAEASPDEPRPKRPALGGTALAVDVPRGPALPFAGEIKANVAPPAPPPAPLPAPLPAPPDPAKRKKLGELRFGMEIPKNLPLARAAYTPPLTLEQHASLAVELGLAPDKTAETLARYHLTNETRAQLDAHYGAKIAASPETRAAWDRACQSYTTWLAASRRPAR